MTITLQRRNRIKNLLKRLFYSKDYKPKLLYEYTQGETSFVKRAWTCEIVYGSNK
jgi:hypothetical protein